MRRYYSNEESSRVFRSGNSVRVRRDRVRAMQTQAMEQPRELQELTARI
jgi:hypothetical protein